MQEQKENNRKNTLMVTREEILGWVRETIAANGEKYTVLTKEAQLGIARFIDELVNERKEDAEKEATKPSNAPDGSSDAELPVEKTESKEDGKDAVSDCDRASIPTDNIKAQMRRVDFLRSKGMDAQAIYESFLKWKKCNPSKATVMDFSNGEKVECAAFVCWLTEFVA